MREGMWKTQWKMIVENIWIVNKPSEVFSLSTTSNNLKMQNQVQSATGSGSPVAIFTLGGLHQDEANRPLLESPSTENTAVNQQIPEIIISEPSPYQSIDNDSEKDEITLTTATDIVSDSTFTDHQQIADEQTSRGGDVRNDRNNNAQHSSENSQSITTAAEDLPTNLAIESEEGLSTAKEKRKRWQVKYSTTEVVADSTKIHQSSVEKSKRKPTRKYSLPATLLGPAISDDYQEEDMEIGRKSTRSKLMNDKEIRRQNSIFGDFGVNEEDYFHNKSSSEFGFKNQLFSFFQASDNKLAMKLFGSRNALLKEKRRQFVSNTWIIHPCSNFRLYWDLLMLMFLVTNLIVLPVAIAFFFNDTGSHWMVFNITCDILFILDIAINFRTGLIDHESHGEIILDGKTIAIRYLKGWFVVDFLSSLPLDYILLTVEGQLYTAGRAIRILRLTKILQLLRLLRISRLVRYVRIWQEYFSLANIVVRIFNLISVMVLLSHWSGCIQFAVPVLQGWPEDSWISTENLHDVHWWEQYTKSLFKALSHMLCIGYGQYPPRNVTETWLTIASMLSGATCYALFIGHATALIQSFDTSSRQFRDHLQQVNEYMSFRKLPPDLRQRITTYYDHRYGGKMFDEHIILSELSETLRNDIINHNCKELTETVPFFVNADPNFVNSVITKLEFEMFQPGDTIIKADTPGYKMYFIQEGVVEVFNEEGHVVTRLSDGSYFGEISLMTKKNRTATIRASAYCNLFSLSKDHFDQILVSYPVMKRTLETVAAQRLHHLGKNPSLVASRESLLDDLSGFKQVMQVNSECMDVDEEEQQEEPEPEAPSKDGQFLNAVKCFFTKDSENFAARARSSRMRSYSPNPVNPRRSTAGTNNNSNIERCKSNLQYIMAPKITPLRRRVQSTADLQSGKSNSDWMERMPTLQRRRNSSHGYLPNIEPIHHRSLNPCGDTTTHQSHHLCDTTSTALATSTNGCRSCKLRVSFEDNSADDTRLQ